MTHDSSRSALSPSAALFTLYVAAVLSIVMILFPPYDSLNGTEYAFVLTGPAWSSNMGALGENLGLTASIHWVLLLVQLAAVWAIALGARFFFARSPTTLILSGPVLLFVSLLTTI